MSRRGEPAEDGEDHPPRQVHSASQPAKRPMTRTRDGPDSLRSTYPSDARACLIRLSQAPSYAPPGERAHADFYPRPDLPCGRVYRG